MYAPINSFTGPALSVSCKGPINSRTDSPEILPVPSLLSANAGIATDGNNNLRHLQNWQRIKDNTTGFCRMLLMTPITLLSLELLNILQIIFLFLGHKLTEVS